MDAAGRPLILPERDDTMYIHWIWLRRTSMIKRLTKHGNSLALVIDRPVLDLLEIDSDTPISVTTDGECLIISPVRDKKREKAFRTALTNVNKRYGRALRRLAK